MQVKYKHVSSVARCIVTKVLPRFCRWKQLRRTNEYSQRSSADPAVSQRGSGLRGREVFKLFSAVSGFLNQRRRPVEQGSFAGQPSRIDFRRSHREGGSGEVGNRRWQLQRELRRLGAIARESHARQGIISFGAKLPRAFHSKLAIKRQYLSQFCARTSMLTQTSWSSFNLRGGLA